MGLRLPHCLYCSCFDTIVATKRLLGFLDGLFGRDGIDAAFSVLAGVSALRLSGRSAPAA
jgi:hypothetical protein